MTVKQENILKEYRRYLELKSIKTVNQYISSVKEYFNYLNDNIEKEFDKVNQSIGDDYRTYLVTGEIVFSRLTINNKLNRLNSFYHFLLKKRYIYSNPFYKLYRLRNGKTIPKNILSVNDMAKLLDNFSILKPGDIMLKSIIEILYGSGLRISEVVNLKLKDVDFETGYLYVTEGKNNGRRRKVVAGEVSLKTLKYYLKYLEEKNISYGEYIYPRKCPTSIMCQLNWKLKRECKRLNLKTITTHSFRHSVATHILRKGANIREVQEFLGHKSINATEIYTRVVKEDLKNVIEKFHPREIEEEQDE